MQSNKRTNTARHAIPYRAHNSDVVGHCLRNESSSEPFTAGKTRLPSVDKWAPLLADLNGDQYTKSVAAAMMENQSKRTVTTKKTPLQDFAEQVWKEDDEKAI